MLKNCLPVLPGGITHIFVPAIEGILLVQGKHIFIPVCFGQDGGRCNRSVYPVTLYNTGMGDIPIGFKAISIDQEMLGNHLQFIKCPVHGEKGGIEDVDLINFLLRDYPHTPGQCLLLNQCSQ